MPLQPRDRYPLLRGDTFLWKERINLVIYTMREAR
jgi:hypothetical protein